MLDVFADREAWIGKAPEIASECVSRYSLESMVEAIVAALEA
jgi:hypothetical protein